MLCDASGARLCRYRGQFSDWQQEAPGVDFSAGECTSARQHVSQPASQPATTSARTAARFVSSLVLLFSCPLVLFLSSDVPWLGVVDACCAEKGRHGCLLRAVRHTLLQTRTRTPRTHLTRRKLNAVQSLWHPEPCLASSCAWSWRVALNCFNNRVCSRTGSQSPPQSSRSFSPPTHQQQNTATGTAAAPRGRMPPQRLSHLH